MCLIESNIFKSLITINRSVDKNPNFVIKKDKITLCEESVQSFPVQDCGCGKKKNCDWAKKGSLYKIIFAEYEKSLFASVFSEYFHNEDSDFSIRLDKKKTKDGRFKDLIYYSSNDKGKAPDIIVVFDR